MANCLSSVSDAPTFETGENSSMNRREYFNKSLVCFVLLTLTLGCTTTRPFTASSPQELVDLVAVGDAIEIERKNGTRATLKVTDVSKDGISGDGIFVAYADIKQILVTRENRVGTGLMVILGISVLYALEKNADCGIFTWDSECDE